MKTIVAIREFPKLNQCQGISNKQLEQVVRYSIDVQFFNTMLNDERMPDLFKETTDKELKEDMVDLFFKSFTEILSSLGISTKDNIKMRLTWLKYSFAKTFDISELDRYSTLKDYKDIQFLRSRNYIRRIKLQFSKPEPSRLQTGGIWYYRDLTEWIEAISDYVIHKKMFAPLLEAAKVYRYSPEIVHKDGRKIIPFNLTNVLAYVGEDHARELKSLEHRIWEPEIGKEADRDSIRIGRGYYF